MEGELLGGGGGVTAAHRCTDLRDSCGLRGSWGEPTQALCLEPLQDGLRLGPEGLGEEGPPGRWGWAQLTGVLSSVVCFWLGADGRGTDAQASPVLLAPSALRGLSSRAKRGGPTCGQMELSQGEPALGARVW